MSGPSVPAKWLYRGEHFHHFHQQHHHDQHHHRHHCHDDSVIAIEGWEFWGPLPSWVDCNLSVQPGVSTLGKQVMTLPSQVSLDNYNCDDNGGNNGDDNFDN